ncbi:aminoglycoside phosphotransferase family protein [Candidatus Poribacteria bacterium]|nr:aminoglycoside phosphotransferase family protein [Candidatus Poribacteria bacterium]
MKSSRNFSEPPSDALRWVVDSVGPGAKIQSVWGLAGATSSAVYGIEVEYNGRRFKLVLRLFVKEDWLAEEPDLALHEAESLKKAGDADLPTPDVIAYDEKGFHCGVPAVLMTYLPGVVELKPVNLDNWLYQLAESLISVHAVEVGTYRWRYFSWNDLSCLEPPSWSKHRELWEKAIEIVLQPEPEERACFIHRDYHPTNVLWQDNRISGVIDWVNACLGPASVDLSHCRGNLFALYGVAAADRFLHAYQSLVGGAFEYQPYWDLTAAIGALPEPGIYPPWIEFGIRHLNTDILKERADEFLASVMARF